MSDGGGSISTSLAICFGLVATVGTELVRHPREGKGSELASATLVPVVQLTGTAQKVRNVPATAPGTTGVDIHDHGLGSLRPPHPGPPISWNRGSLVFSLPGSGVLETHPGRLQEESEPHPTPATVGSCLSDLGMWGRSQPPRALGPGGGPAQAATPTLACPLHQPLYVSTVLWLNNWRVGRPPGSATPGKPLSLFGNQDRHPQ